MIKEKLQLEDPELREQFYNPNKSWINQYDARDWFMKYGKIGDLLEKYGFSLVDTQGEFCLYSRKRGIKLDFDSYYRSLTKQLMEEEKGTHKLGVVYLSRGVVVDNELTEGFEGRIIIPLILDGSLTQEEFFPFIEDAMKELDGGKFSFR